ncbi:Iron import ATP-binding/permease protein IrtB [Actinomyces bovis]|uniref:Iron import ATP-binding/permease protein IrtB n=1 Tax=Actinomyces bovis TaxID=1658 RepID=A0ABY1VLX5_9ACTO|nr:ABC transporter ATP-binding protein [Actinomyces bovis]SPT52682.1 Iron import ATP-binding/permease protein IrtB [Actinomyces bovis]VEG54608.1 Iron import ATP-binding/permease protein IrtB [Actinomyces israelii]
MWKILLRLVNAREMRRILVWFMASAVLQGLTLALMIPFLRAFYTNGPGLGGWLTAIVILGLVTMVVDTTAMFRSYRVSVFEICDTMIDRVAEHVLALPLGWFNAQREAAVVNATSKEVNTLSHLTSMVIPNLCNAFLVPLVMLVATVFVDPAVALVMAVTAIILYLLWRRMAVATHRANELEDQAAAAAAGRLVEFARLQAVLRASGATERGWEPVRTTLEADAAATLAGLRIKGRPAQVFNLVVNLAFACAMALALSSIGGQRLDVFGYLAVMTVVSRMLMPLTKAAMYSAEADNARVALTAMSQILDAQPLPEPEASQRAQVQGTRIELVDVDFAYDADRPVLGGVSLTAEQGRVTALVGPSGAGKSTILRLVMRFLDVDRGRVLIGGADVRDLPSNQVMDLTSMVFQDVYLFDTTIRENLRVARPEATDAELEAAAKRARLDQVIAALPHGWDTRVGPGGLSLSGGERQRVAIARAFIKDAPILLLDEITSALDGENESAITEVVRELSQGRTVLVVAHRLSTIRRADEVVFLQPAQGGARVVQRGTPAELAAVPGPYRDFIEAATASSRWHLARA